MLLSENIENTKLENNAVSIAAHGNIFFLLWSGNKKKFILLAKHLLKIK